MGTATGPQWDRGQPTLLNFKMQVEHVSVTAPFATGKYQEVNLFKLLFYWHFHVLNINIIWSALLGQPPREW